MGLMGLVMSAACASAPERVTPASPEETADSTTLASRSQQIDQDIARNEWLLAHGDEEMKLRAHLGLAETHWDRAGLTYWVRYELYEEGAPTKDREAFDRMSAELEREHDEHAAIAEREYRIVVEASGPVADELRPRARFGLAGIHRDRGDLLAMRSELETLVHDAPGHPLAASAWLQLGDLDFDEMNLDRARAAYARVVELGKSDNVLYARYKLGWIALNLDEPQRALDEWTEVVLRGRVIPRSQPLARTAAKDCVRAFAVVGQPEQAGAFFHQLYPELASELMQSLSDQYRDEGRLEDAAKVMGHPVDPGTLGR